MQPENEGKSKISTWVLVGLLHLVFGYILVSGLAVKVVKSITGPIETINIEDQAPPPDEPPPPPPKLEDIPPYVPPPDVVIETLAPPPPTITTQTQVQQTAPVAVAPPAPPAPPAPAPEPKVEITRPSPRGGTVTVGTDDYPSASLRACEQGAVAVQVLVGTDGRVKQCSVAQSSGHPRLDEQTCTVAQRRWRYNPGRENNTPVEMTITQRVRWVVERGC
ncbi:MAG: energy transducer TonB [Sphingomonadaceae bacterium]